jgi:hypothetical protein
METSDLDEQVRRLELELATHEVQCEERWKTNFSRLTEIERQLSRMESMIRAGGATTILFLLGIIASILM